MFFVFDWEIIFVLVVNCYCIRCINVRGIYYNGECSLDEFKLIEVWYIRDLFFVDFLRYGEKNC